MAGTGLITGEAVELDLRPATFASRAVSGLIDVVIQGIALFLMVLLLTWLGASLDGAALTATVLSGFVAVLLGYPVVLETLTRGRTVGKWCMGLRTVRDDGGPIRFRHALVRGLLELVEVWILFGSPALICSLLSSRGKRLGDLLAGTYVVRLRGAAMASQAPMMPWELVPWAQQADLGRLPDPLAIAVRQFLSRAPHMHLAARQAMGAALVAQVQPHVAPAPPAYTHPEAFLSAVLAERRRRDSVRLANQAAFVARLTSRR